jgi:flavin reductase (DIM6/NTAB) family NADH-FMN oxidoreductase RutF
VALEAEQPLRHDGPVLRLVGAEVGPDGARPIDVVDGSRGTARYRDGTWEAMPSRALGNSEALALIDCQLEEAIDRHSHTILIGRPTHIRIREEAEPLVYWHGAYRLLSSLDRVLTRA